MSVDQSDSPFHYSAEHLKRIRVRAYHLWESEGRPEGQAEAYWQRAEELDAIEHNPPAPKVEDNPNVHHTPEGVLIEEAFLQENLGEFPARSNDLGDAMPTPESREIAREFREGER